MSYTVPLPGERLPEAGGRPVRPAAVTVAAGLLAMFALLGLGEVVLGLVTVGDEIDQINRFYDELVGPREAAAAVRVFEIFLYGTLALYFLGAIGYALLAVFVARGLNGARITTWVIGGITILFCGCGLLLNLQNPSTGRAASRDLAATIGSSTPAWAVVTGTVIAALGLVALVASIVLLAVPAAHPYFRKWAPQERLPDWQSPYQGV